jgi:gephyrin
LDKVASGLQIAMVTRSLSYTPLAMLSRPIAGIRQNTLIITLPGSVKACLEYLGILQPALLHAVQLVRGQNTYQHPTLVTANDATTNISKSQPSNEEGGSHLERRHSFPPEVSVETAPATLPRRHASMRDSQINHSCPHHSASSVAQRHRSSPYRMFSVAEAEKVITSHCPLGVVERIAVDEHAAMRILAEDIYAPRNVPCVPVSLVDGYAMGSKFVIHPRIEIFKCLNSRSIEN